MGQMGLGVDIEEVSRFKSLIRNRKFLKRIFTPAEIAYCLSKKNRAQHFAVRFAAKEAVWKALSILPPKQKSGLRHTDIGVKNDQRGKPQITFPKSLVRLQKKVEVSLSHTRSACVAVALIKP